MKTKFYSVFIVLAALAIGTVAHAATITWTNTAGGNWSDATSWNPNQVPGSSDDAVITASGTYIVTLDASPTINSLTLGGSGGQQTLAMGSLNLTLNNASVVNANGIIGLGGGVLSSSALTIKGQLNWTAGRIGAGSILTVATNGVLTLAGGSAYLDFSGVLTNAGTIQLVNAGLRCIDLNSYGGGIGELVNLPGALIDVQSDVSIYFYTDGSGSATPPSLVNQGTLRKSGGTGISYLNSQSGVTPSFYNSGTVDAQTGTISVNVGGNGNGTFKAEAGATLAFGIDYEVDSALTGAGTNLFYGGTFTLNGSLATSNAMLNAGILTGNGIIKGQLTWTAGQIGTNSTLTVATNGVLTLAGSGEMEFSGILTNAGTIQLVSGNLRCIDFSTYGGGIGELVNLPGALIDVQSDVGIDFYTDGSGSATPPSFVNQGTLRKSGGSGISSLNTQAGTPAFYNSGTVDVQTGTISVNVVGNGNGTFKAEAGATLAFAVDYEVDSALTGAGTNLFSGGTFTLNGTLATSNAMLNAGVLTGNGTIKGVLTWTAGRIGAGSTLTVATNGVLTVAGSGDLDLSGVLTNAGTIQLVSGNLRCIDYSSYGGGIGELLNLPGALVEVRADVNIDYYTDGSGSATPPSVVNEGTLRKSGGTNTTIINTPFYNTGTLDAQSGTISVSDGGVNSGTFDAEAGATLAIPQNYELEGQLIGPGNLLNGGVLTGTNGIIKGVLTWTSGRIGTGSTLTVATNGVLTVAANVDFSGILTNAGTVQLVGGNLRCIDYSAYGGGIGELLNLPGALVDMQADVTIDYYNDNSGGATPSVVNQGTVRKSGGTSVTYINAPFYNTGTLDAQTGIINLTGDYTLTGGRLNFGINSLTNYGQISLSRNPTTLDGALSVNFNNGYSPIRGNSFDLVSYASETGTFTGFILPQTIAWQTNYNLTAFNLTVLNSAPILPGQTNRTVNELTTLTVTNTATDLDLPPDTLTYSLLAAPGDAGISASGVITWTPTEAQGPSTNTFTTRVMDNGSPSLSATNTFTVIVNEINVAPVLPVIAQTNVNELTTLTVTNTSTDTDIPVNPLTYTLLQSPANAVISTNGVITWTPSQVQSPSTNTITTVVTDTNMFAVNAKSLSTTNSFTVIVKEVNVAPVLPAIAQTTVNELALLTVTNTAGESNIHSAITGYGLVNPPAGMNISAGGIITWTPSQAESPGTNIITTVVTNSNPYDLVNPHLTATNSFTVIVKEVNVAPVLPVVAQTNVNELALLTVINTATNANIHSTNATYALVNPPAGMSISANGIITWTPGQTQSPSTNIITTVVTNTNPYDLVNPHLTATNSFTVVVQEVNVAPTLPTIPTQTFNELTLLTLTNTAGESNIHATLGYALAGPPAGMSISANGIITWTPTEAQGPSTNVITTVVTNSDSFDTVNPHLAATNSFTVIVNEVNVAPVLGALNNFTVNPGQTVSFTATATDSDLPANILTFTLVSPPSGATINSISGLFNWRTTVAQVNTTNAVQVRVTDNGVPNLSDNKSFTVIVNPLSPVILTPISRTSGQFKLQVSGTTGPDYIISASGTLTNWTDLVTNLSPATPFQFTDTNAPSTNRFYRARMSP